MLFEGLITKDSSHMFSTVAHTVTFSSPEKSLFWLNYCQTGQNDQSGRTCTICAVWTGRCEYWEFCWWAEHVTKYKGGAEKWGRTKSSLTNENLHRVLWQRCSKFVSWARVLIRSWLSSRLWHGAFNSLCTTLMRAIPLLSLESSCSFEMSMSFISVQQGVFGDAGCVVP